MQQIDVVAVEPLRTSARTPLGRAADGAARGEVDDALDHPEQRVDPRAEINIAIRSRARSAGAASRPRGAAQIEVANGSSSSSSADA